MSNPHMMFYCPDKLKRERFIDKFLSYYIYNWSKKGEAFLSPSRMALASLADRDSLEYGLSGKNAVKLRMDACSRRILIHRGTVEEITNILIPRSMQTKIMMLHCSPVNNADEIAALTDEIKELARGQGFAVAFETFSKTVASFMEAMGFEIGYQRQFLDTQFLQTVMTYNVEK